MKTNKKTNNIKSDLEPIIDDKAYALSLSKALIYYNDIFQPIDYKNAVLDYIDVVSLKLPKGIPDYEFRSIGAVCRLLLREQFISIQHVQNIHSKIHLLSCTYADKDIPPHEINGVEPVRTKVVVDITKKYIAWLEDNIDNHLIKGSPLYEMRTEYSIYSFNKTENSRIIKYLESTIDKYTKDYKDFGLADVKDAYSFTTKDVLKSLIKSLSEFKSSIEVINSKTVKAPVRKDKPAIAQVAKIQYNKEFDGMKSLHPKDVIGKSVVYIFDTETRDLIVLHALSSKFKASGQAFVNLDESKCFKKKIRKPEEFFPIFMSQVEQNKSTYRELFDSIKTTEQKAVGRMNENKIILRIF